jgi:hypothetical protein
LLDGRGLEFARLQDDCGFPRAVQDDRSQLVGVINATGRVLETFIPRPRAGICRRSADREFPAIPTDCGGTT